MVRLCVSLFFFFQAEDGIRDLTVTGVQTCALPIWKELRIRGLKELSERVVPFFKANPLRTVKRSSFDCFAEVIRIMQRGDHLTSEGLTRIRELAGRMNRGSQNPQRPYAGSPT